MKKQWFVPAAAAVLLSCPGSCAGTPSFSSVQGKQWKLVEVKNNPAAAELLPDPIRFDRSKLKTEGMDDIFVLTFSSSAQVSGKAAPETYTASYERGTGQAVFLKQVSSDHVERDLVPERLREADYFALLEGISRWDYKEGKLELYSTSPDGQEVVLTFVLD
ncbi:MAG: META domain-containing protein [Treponema sp.]|nr:META domain-containing protein [Treponema sp.]